MRDDRRHDGSTEPATRMAPRHVFEARIFIFVCRDGQQLSLQGWARDLSESGLGAIVAQDLIPGESVHRAPRAIGQKQRRYTCHCRSARRRAVWVPVHGSECRTTQAHSTRLGTTIGGPVSTSVGRVNVVEIGGNAWSRSSQPISVLLK